MIADVKRFRGVDIDKGIWKGWTQYDGGTAYQKLYGKDVIHAEGGYFYVYKDGAGNGLRGSFSTLKEAEAVLK